MTGTKHVAINDKVTRELVVGFVISETNLEKSIEYTGTSKCTDDPLLYKPSGTPKEIMLLNVSYNQNYY